MTDQQALGMLLVGVAPLLVLLAGRSFLRGLAAEVRRTRGDS